jgi:hypothetical protein
MIMCPGRCRLRALQVHSPRAVCNEPCDLEPNLGIYRRFASGQAWKNGSKTTPEAAGKHSKNDPLFLWNEFRDFRAFDQKKVSSSIIKVIDASVVCT